MIDLEVKLAGFDDVKRVFAALPPEIAKRALRGALMSGARLLQEQAKAMAPKAPGGSRYWATGGHAPGRLKKSIVARARPVTRSDGLTVSVGALRSAYYWHMVEFGHRLVRGSRKRNRRVIGQVAAKPYLRPAFAAASQAAVQKVFAALGPRIIGIARGLRRRVGGLGGS